jgi:ABC-type phosphate transport system auxiliary subunit
LQRAAVPRCKSSGFRCGAAAWRPTARHRALFIFVLLSCGTAYSSRMSNEIVTVDSVRKWTKDRLRSIKDLQKQLAKSVVDVDSVVKQLDAEGWKDFRKKARQLKAQSRTASSFKNRLVKEASRESKRFTKVLEQLQAK